ncbi:glycosyltransferase family 4 protein [Pelagibacterium mangrovi]|uniref:glycosyltransferase family 4 protein n=1 Tax=Pelagibacterium mangrovi TaxID=3119828 RepID=UPI002FC5EEE3
MRIAFISQYFYPEQFSNNALSRELVRRGHEVHAFPCVPNYPEGTFHKGYSNTQRREDEWKGIRISRSFTVPRGRTAVTLLLNYLVYPFAASWTMFRRMDHPADVSFVSMPSPLFQAFAGVVLRWRTKAPCVYWVQDIWPESATFTLGITNRFAVALLNGICGWLYRRADLVMVQSAAFRPMIMRFGVRPEKIAVLPNTAPDSYRPVLPQEAPEEGRLVPTEGFRLMFAGNIGESQDFDTLIEAAELLREQKDLHWIIIGSGRDEPRVRQVVEDRGLSTRFRFLGRHPEEAMPRFFAHADAMIVSLKDAPIFGLTVPYKVQCYLACGKPIIASLSGEGARIVEESGAGIAVPAGQPRMLANSILAMMQATRQTRDAHATNARQYFEDTYSADKIYNNLERALIKVVASRKPPIN